jgi:hypothetical protein
MMAELQISAQCTPTCRILTSNFTSPEEFTHAHKNLSISKTAEHNIQLNTEKEIQISL